MNLNGTTALVTGANRGLGRHFAEQLLQRGATKVYAAARDPRTIDLPGVVPLQLDITDPDSVARAAAVATDVDVLINNAGISLHQNLVDGDLDKIRLELETNFFGTLNVVRAFTPVRAILNVNSRLSWLSYWAPAATRRRRRRSGASRTASGSSCPTRSSPGST